MPVLGRDRESFVIAPRTVDVEITRREPFVAEPDSADEREGSRVVRLHVGLNSVESLNPERVSQSELEGLSREALARGGGVGVEAAVAALKAAMDDLTQVHDGDKRVVVDTPPDERHKVAAHGTGEQGSEAGLVGRRPRPRMVQ